MKQYSRKEKPQQGTSLHYVVQALLSHSLARSLSRIRPNTPPLLRFAHFANLKLYLTTQNVPHLPSRRPEISLDRSQLLRSRMLHSTTLKALPSFLHRSIRPSMISGGRCKYAGPVGSRPQDLITGRSYSMQQMQTPKDVRAQTMNR